MSNKYASKDLSHHGIVSVVCDEIGIVETIDSLIPQSQESKITLGESVKLMIINGLGFSSRPLYLQSQFFESKPIKHLLGRDVESESISDDRLGRCLESCYSRGCDEIFSSIATKAALKFNVDKKFRHLDTTSMNVAGEYGSEEGIGLVQFGYSKDGRGDLKQFMISLMSSKDGDVPLLSKTIAGNTSDKTHFQEVLSSLKDQIDPNKPSYYICDSALYTQESISKLSDQIMWITRVPESIKSAKQLITLVSVSDMENIDNGYRIYEIGNNYGKVNQRWLLVYSEHAYRKQIKTLEKNVVKEGAKKKKELKNISTVIFKCEADAISAAERFDKQLKYHKIGHVEIIAKNIKSEPGRPKKNDVMNVGYMIKTSLQRDEKKIQKLASEKGKFVIATNELDLTKLTNIELLETYKGQQSVERGFRFLKDPLFMASSVFLKNEDRIVALGMIMCLCLLVYTLAQRLLRMNLKEKSASIANQKGKPTNKPTMRWVFQLFEGIHVLFVKTNGKTQNIVLNMSDERLYILEMLGTEYVKKYQSLA